MWPRSSSNRSALIRIPAHRGGGNPVELRSPDPTCNPYLALAVTLAAGLDGIERFMTPPSGGTGEPLRHGQGGPPGQRGGDPAPGPE